MLQLHTHTDTHQQQVEVENLKKKKMVTGSLFHDGGDDGTTLLTEEKTAEPCVYGFAVIGAAYLLKFSVEKQWDVIQVHQSLLQIHQHR